MLKTLKAPPDWRDAAICIIYTSTQYIIQDLLRSFKVSCESTLSLHACQSSCTMHPRGVPALPLPLPEPLPRSSCQPTPGLEPPGPCSNHRFWTSCSSNTLLTDPTQRLLRTTGEREQTYLRGSRRTWMKLRDDDQARAIGMYEAVLPQGGSAICLVQEPCYSEMSQATQTTTRPSSSCFRQATTARYSGAPP